MRIDADHERTSGSKFVSRFSNPGGGWWPAHHWCCSANSLVRDTGTQANREQIAFSGIRSILNCQIAMLMSSNSIRCGSNHVVGGPVTPEGELDFLENELVGHTRDLFCGQESIISEQDVVVLAELDVAYDIVLEPILLNVRDKPHKLAPTHSVGNCVTHLTHLSVCHLAYGLDRALRHGLC